MALMPKNLPQIAWLAPLRRAIQRSHVRQKGYTSSYFLYWVVRGTRLPPQRPCDQPHEARAAMEISELKPGVIIHGTVLPKPIELFVVSRLGDVYKVVGGGKTTRQAPPASLPSRPDHEE